MYRHVTLRFTDLPHPVPAATKQYGVRLIGYPLRRRKDALFASEYLFLVRGAGDALDAMERVLAAAGPVPRLDCAEPGARLYQAPLDLPATGPMKGLIKVVGDALGTVLDHEPLIAEDGVLELRLVTIPARDSALRLQAIEQHAKEAGLPLEIPDRRALTAPPVVAPRSEALDLLDWETLSALEAAGCYDEPPQGAVEAVTRELAEALGLGPEETARLVQTAQRRLLREAVAAWRRNIRLATPPGRPQDDAP